MRALLAALLVLASAGEAAAATVVYLHDPADWRRGAVVSRWQAKAKASGFTLVAPTTLDPSALDAVAPPYYLVAAFGAGEAFYIALCERGADIMAAAVVAGRGADWGCDHAGQPVPILALHGDADLYFAWTADDDHEVGFHETGARAFEEQALRNGCRLEFDPATWELPFHTLDDCAVSTEELTYSCQNGWPGLWSGSFWWWTGIGCTNSFRAEDVIVEFFEAQ